MEDCRGSLYSVVEVTLKRKIVSCVLVASLSFYIGCYSTEMVSKDELKAKSGQVDITIFAKDSLEYEFTKGNYRILGDTLSGYGIRKQKVSTEVISDASLSFAVIDSIQTREFDLPRTIAFCGGIGLGVVVIITLLFQHNQSATVVVPSVVAGPRTSY
jgi:hypothetical protein